MSDQPNFSKQIEKAIEQNSTATDVDRVERRRCSSDHFDGAEYRIYGAFINIRPIIDFIRGVDGFKIETISFVNDVPDETRLSVFVADLRHIGEDDAFTNART